MPHIFLLLPVAKRSNPFSIVHLRRLISFEQYHYNNSLDSKTNPRYKCVMVWSSSAQGNRPYAPSTRQIVCIVVTPRPENGIFCSLCFQSLAHSFAGVFSTTPLQSYCSALFAKNTGGGYTPHNLLRVFKHLRTLAPIQAARMEFIPTAVASLFHLPFSLFVTGRASDRIRSLFFDILIFEQEHYGIEV
jgi:hypothetical protein